MYNYKLPTKTTLRRNESYPGERIEKKMQRVLNNQETIKDGAPLIYTERKDGVRPELNIRTDKWEIAAEAMDRVNRERATLSTPNPTTTTSEDTATVEATNKEAGGQSVEGTSSDQSKK